MWSSKQLKQLTLDKKYLYNARQTCFFFTSQTFWCPSFSLKLPLWRLLVWERERSSDSFNCGNDILRDFDGWSLTHLLVINYEQIEVGCQARKGRKEIRRKEAEYERSCQNLYNTSPNAKVKKLCTKQFILCMMCEIAASFTSGCFSSSSSKSRQLQGSTLSRSGQFS